MKKKTLDKRNKQELRKKRRAARRRGIEVKPEWYIVKEVKIARNFKVGEEVKLVSGNYPSSYIGKNAKILEVNPKKVFLQVPGRKTPLEVDLGDLV